MDTELKFGVVVDKSLNILRLCMMFFSKFDQNGYKSIIFQQSSETVLHTKYSNWGTDLEKIKASALGLWNVQQSPWGTILPEMKGWLL